ncbi:MAG: phenylalanine--tRNA ligase subunit beta [Spirochaetia bacterium]|nr:phenylalanine--tRNA ligase subunit beta [Spirochaetia bacterium]
MNLSYNWLNEFIDLSEIKPEDLANLLTMKTCEVEKSEPFMPLLDNIYVAQVNKVEKHPDADKLFVCQVDYKKEKVQVVTGAPNVTEGKKYPIAPVGSCLPNGMVMKHAKLRGLDSFGMLCSVSELELEDFILAQNVADGIMPLPDDFTVGMSIREALHLNDTIIEIDNKSITHRPDLWGHAGFARELSAILKRPLKFNPFEDYNDKKITKDDNLKPVSVVIENNSATAYGAAVLKNIVIKPSSYKIQAYLLAAGMRPINNVVDVSNYVMLELGQPNHAFDRNFIKKKIKISYSKKNEKVTTLDEKEHTLPDGLVLIRDDNKPIALGGVMGGLETEVSESTKEIFLESASFHRKDIRKAVSSLNIRTEASQRFEKGQDPLNAEKAIYRFASLLKETCPEIVLGNVEVVYDEQIKENIIETSYGYIKNRLGNINISDNEIKNILISLGMKCEEKSDKLFVTVPGYRSQFDLTIADDIVEEIGRMAGYENIKTEPFMVSCEVPQYENKIRKLQNELIKTFAGTYQFTEVYNYAFQSAEDIAVDTRHSKEAISLQNAINAEMTHMRISPLTGLLKCIKQNQKEYSNLRFFEVERIFLPVKEKNTKGLEKDLPEERHFIAAVISSQEEPEKILNTMSSVISDILTRLGLTYYNQKWERGADEIFHQGRAGRVRNKEGTETYFKWGEVHPKIIKKYGIKRRVFYLEAFVEELIKIQKERNYIPLCKYPAAEFECTILTDEFTEFAEIAKSIGIPESNLNKTDKTYLESLEYLTAYAGDPIPKNKKAVSIKVKWRNRSRTIDHEEFKKLQQSLVFKLKEAGFPLRA